MSGDLPSDLGLEHAVLDDCRPVLVAVCAGSVIDMGKLLRLNSSGAGERLLRPSSSYGIDHGLAVGVLSAALLHDLERKAPDAADLVLGALRMSSPVEFSDFVAGCVVRSGLAASLRSEALHHKGLEDAVRLADRSRRSANHPVPLDDSTVDTVRAEFRALLVRDGVPA